MTDAGARRSVFWPTLLAGLGLAVLLGLGTWQLQRLAWKEALIAEIVARRAAEPLASLPRTMDPALEFRRASLAGRFLHDKEMRLQSRTRAGRPGVELVTPLALADGSVVLVNRGWVPTEKAAPEARPETRTEGEVRVDGLVRVGERLGWATPANRPNDGLWFAADPAAIAAFAGLDAVPYLVVMEGEGAALPRPRAPAALPPNDHLSYAVTWYALAGALAVVYVLAIRRMRR
ncbi:MAG: SURF1 family protein [Alphaproteobacteria bacterium]|nr:SURF1 family protein [Alphaproteobacteria bacterium]